MRPRRPNHARLPGQPPRPYPREQPRKAGRHELGDASANQGDGQLGRSLNSKPRVRWIWTGVSQTHWGSCGDRRSKELDEPMTDQSSKQRRRTLICPILAIAATHDQWARCWAQEVKDVHAGYELASEVCSPCHVVVPLPAPSFMDIAKSQYGSLAPLENLLRSTHSDVGHPGGMPNISLSKEQIRTISAYIGSLREAR